jgi:hypothetical protein
VAENPNFKKKEKNFTKKWKSNKNQNGLFGTGCGEGWYLNKILERIKVRLDEK